MNSYERLAAIGRHYGVATAYPEHQILDCLDKVAGIDTKGDTEWRTDSYGTCRKKPKNYIGTRLRLHEEHIEASKPHHFWLGAEG